MNFDADVAQLIQLVTHSIYSNTDIFLRELISNANDALQKAKIKSLANTSYLWDEVDLWIYIDTDPEKKTVTITDTWIGMSKDEVIEHIWTIAKSGTKAFLENMKQQETTWTDLIWQFWIWFYSAFMVAKKVELETKSVWEDAVKWSSVWDWSYEISKSSKTTRWTVITLHLNSENDNDAYADYYRLRGLIKKHSNYVPMKICMYKLEESKPTQEWETINQQQSLWTKQKSSVTQDEYDDFFKSMTFSQEWPFDTLHLHIEGGLNFKALLYLPQSPSPFESMQGEQEHWPSLYVQNVLIKDRCPELLPVWLRFVRWVVETPDLSLNVSREILQDNWVLQKIQKSLVSEILKSLVYLKKNESEKYTAFLTSYGRYLKEWVHYSVDNKEKIASLLNYFTLEDWVQWLDAYLTALYWDDEKSDDTWSDDWDSKPIYYLTWKSVHEITHSPYLEQFKEHNINVLLMDDPLDEYVIQALWSYKDHPLVSASDPSIALGDKKKEEKKQKATEKKAEEHKDFLSSLHSFLWEDVLENVEFTHKIWDNLAVLITPQGQATPQMERIMKAMGQDVPPVKRILHINDEHHLVKGLLKEYDWSKKIADEDLMRYIYEQAVLLEWWELEDMTWHIKRINRLLQK